MNMRNFEISKYWSVYITSFQILTPTRRSKIWPPPKVKIYVVSTR